VALAGATNSGSHLRTLNAKEVGVGMAKKQLGIKRYWLWHRGRSTQEYAGSKWDACSSILGPNL
jgi:hypothetical protein